MIKKLLDELNQLYTQLANAEEGREVEVDKIITDEIKDQLHAINHKYNLPGIQREIEIKKNEIESATLEQGETVKGQYYMAVYSKGRTSWDTKGLEGYAVAYPEVNEFKKVGKPSVSIRGVK